MAAKTDFHCSVTTCGQVTWTKHTQGQQQQHSSAALQDVIQRKNQAGDVSQACEYTVATHHQTVTCFDLVVNGWNLVGYNWIDM